MDTQTLEAARLERKSLTIDAAKLGVLLILYDFIILRYAKNAFLYVYTWIATGNITMDATVINSYVSNKENFASYSAFQMLYSCAVVLMTLAAIVLIARLMGIRLLPLIKLEDKQGRTDAVCFFPVVLLANGVVTALCNIVENFFEESGTVIPTTDFSIDTPTAASILLEIGYLVVVAPLAEEYIFRGLILKTLSPYSKRLAIFVSALLFGLMHGNLSQFFGAFVTGLLFAAIDVKYRSILPSLIMHVLNNILPTFQIIGDAFNSTVVGIVYRVLLYSIMIVGVYVLMIAKKRFLLPKEPEHALSFGHRVLTLTLNIPLLGYTVYLIYLMIAAIITANS